MTDAWQEVGITSTIPVEVLLAAKKRPVDINNRFIASEHPDQMVEEAEQLGLPRNLCAWVKGLYTAIRTSGLQTVIGVVQGDCTHLQSMLEVLVPDGVRFIPFAFPFDRNRYLLRLEIEKLMEGFGVNWDQVKAAKKQLDYVRALAHEADRRAWQEDNLGGRDQFNALVNCSDFKGDPRAYRQELEDLLLTRRDKFPASMLRLGVLGVPPIFTDLFEFLEAGHSRVVYSEVPRQFAMPEYTEDLLEQYLGYTYPYSIYGRVADISRQAKLRRLDGYIHYVQSFCHHQIEDLTLRKRLDLPLLTLEGDRPGPMDARTRNRVEAFLEMLKARNGEKS